jgi:hypothetical protein
MASRRLLRQIGIKSLPDETAPLPLYDLPVGVVRGTIDDDEKMDTDEKDIVEDVTIDQGFLSGWLSVVPPAVIQTHVLCFIIGTPRDNGVYRHEQRHWLVGRRTPPPMHMTYVRVPRYDRYVGDRRRYTTATDSIPVTVESLRRLFWPGIQLMTVSKHVRRLVIDYLETTIILWVNIGAVQLPVFSPPRRATTTPRGMRSMGTHVLLTDYYSATCAVSVDEEGARTLPVSHSFTTAIATRSLATFGIAMAEHRAFRDELLVNFEACRSRSFTTLGGFTSKNRNARHPLYDFVGTELHDFAKTLVSFLPAVIVDQPTTINNLMNSLLTVTLRNTSIADHVTLVPNNALFDRLIWFLLNAGAAVDVFAEAMAKRRRDERTLQQRLSTIRACVTTRIMRHLPTTHGDKRTRLYLGICHAFPNVMVTDTSTLLDVTSLAGQAIANLHSYVYVPDNVRYAINQTVNVLPLCHVTKRRLEVALVDRFTAVILGQDACDRCVFTDEDPTDVIESTAGRQYVTRMKEMLCLLNATSPGTMSFEAVDRMTGLRTMLTDFPTEYMRHATAFEALATEF